MQQKPYKRMLKKIEVERGMDGMESNLGHHQSSWVKMYIGFSLICMSMELKWHWRTVNKTADDIDYLVGSDLHGFSAK